MPKSPSFSAFVASGYTPKSLAALLLVVAAAAGVGFAWSDLLDANSRPDWLLMGIWLGLVLLVCWGVRPFRDLCLALTGLVGGLVIESWGTRTGLWRYFTNERPPLWILPAWPVATLAVERLARWMGWGIAAATVRSSQTPGLRHYQFGYWLTSGTFAVSMGWFVRSTWNQTFTLVVLFTMVLVLFSVRAPREDLLLFAAGTVLGIFLEYWGTSRQCWTYHTGQVPPPVAVPAHGFAALAFGRVSENLTSKFRQLLSR